MGQAYNIFQGWQSYLKGGATDEEKKRAKVCQDCPNAVIGTYEELMPDYSLKEIKGMKCNICKCPLSTKIRSINEKCPLNKWE